MMINIAKETVNRLEKRLNSDDPLVKNDLEILKAALEQIDEHDQIQNEVITDLYKELK